VHQGVSVKRSSVAVLLSGCISLFTLFLVGCGGSSLQPVSVSVSASHNGIDQGQTATVTATVANDSKSAGVQWSVSGGGTLSNQTTTSATYTAPATVTTSITATITATSVTDTTKSASVAIKVNPLPVITNTTLPTATAGTAYSATLTVSGGTGPFTWSITSGTLPLGLTLSGSTGAVTGTPTGTGSSAVTFQVKDAAGNTATQTITITVNPPLALTITTTSLAQASIGVGYSQTLQATGGVPAYKWSLTSGTLPSGLSLSIAGVISGTPNGNPGTSNFTVTVTDSQTPNAASKSANLSIVVTEPPLSITTTSLAQGSINNLYSQTVQAIGGTLPYTWSISAGSLPAGLGLNAATGAITGTPSATGTSNFTVKVTDSTTPTPGTATAALSITINAALAITTASLPGGNIGTAYSATVNASGGVAPYSWSITSGSLPTGLSINSSTGAISGTPTKTETSTFTVTVTDSENPAVKASAALSITIASASCGNNSMLSGNYAMLLNGWSSTPQATTQTVAAAIGSFVADGAGNITGGLIDLNDQVNGPGNGTFTGTFCVGSNNLATINVTYGGAISGSSTFAAALNSSGSNGNIIFYDSNARKASGLLRKQDTTAFSTSAIKGGYAFGLVGAAGGTSAPRYAIAGAFTANGTASLTGEYDSDIYLSGANNASLVSANFNVASSGRGTATITFTGENNLNFVFYVVSASEMLMMEDDAAGSSLLSGQVLQQSGSFTDASLNGISVIELESLSNGSAVAATAGLVTTNGTGSSINFTEDQNVGGTTGTVTASGSYSTSSRGRVALSLVGQASTPVFYLIGQNRAFVVGSNPLVVDFGLMEAQSGSNFSSSSLTGDYLGGSFQPVDSSVNNEVDSLQATGSGGITGTSQTNGSSGPSTGTISETYVVASNGRVVVSQSGAQVGIVYLISDTEIVFLPAGSSDTSPALRHLQQ
jgi:hypothetical protein